MFILKPQDATRYREEKVAEQPVDRPAGFWRLPSHAGDLPSTAITKMELFYAELIRFNRHVNLISKHTELDADIAHLLDSVLGGKIVLKDCKVDTIYDIGSGNGLPGLIMAIIDPKRKFVLVDSDQRKCEFLKSCVSRLELPNVTVTSARLESLPDDSIQAGVSRGFASTSKALLMSRKCFAKGSSYYHFKGSGWVREVAQIPSQLCSIWQPKLLEDYDLPVLNVRMSIIHTKKIG